jgi:hypothetical protein
MENNRHAVGPLLARCPDYRRATISNSIPSGKNPEATVKERLPVLKEMAAGHVKPARTLSLLHPTSFGEFQPGCPESATR